MTVFALLSNQQNENLYTLFYFRMKILCARISLIVRNFTKNGIERLAIFASL